MVRHRPAAAACQTAERGPALSSAGAALHTVWHCDRPWWEARPIVRAGATFNLARIPTLCAATPCEAKHSIKADVNDTPVCSPLLVTLFPSEASVLHCTAHARQLPTPSEPRASRPAPDSNVSYQRSDCMHAGACKRRWPRTHCRRRSVPPRGPPGRLRSPPAKLHACRMPQCGPRRHALLRPHRRCFVAESFCFGIWQSA